MGNANWVPSGAFIIEEGTATPTTTPTLTPLPPAETATETAVPPTHITTLTPEPPVEVSFIPPTDQTIDLFLEDNLLYLADYYTGVRVVDVSDPLHPVVLGSYDPGRVYGVTAVNNRIYAANGNAGLAVLDATDPSNLTLLGSLRTPGLSRHVTLDGHLAYISSWTEGVTVVDISHPAQLLQTAVLDTPAGLKPPSAITIICLLPTMLGDCVSIRLSVSSSMSIVRKVATETGRLKPATYKFNVLSGWLFTSGG